MSRGFTVLVADKHEKDARLVADAVAALALPYPTHVRSAGEALAWVATYECDLCVVDYGLPDLNGLETLIRIHQRRPTLPVILTSNAQSEDVAIAAFHAGVVDYIPKKRGYAALVASVIRQVEQKAPRDRGRERPLGMEIHSGQQAEPAVSPVLVTPVRAATATDPAGRVFQPTYENRLRAIGHELDTSGYRSINLSQVIGGFHVRAIAPRQRTPEVLVFHDHDLQLMMEQTLGKRGTGERVRDQFHWLATGYEDFLRALGYELDQRKAEAITITEFDRVVAVGGVALLDHERQAGLGPFQELLSQEDISRLLDAAFMRRTRKPQGGLAGFLRR
ncbi:MAG TPA: response regulator [Chloroflexota bacterium]|jgi:CheY-like chemotaxis protein|nr:response regulator [Chloroflexota bacterium]